MVLVLIVCSLNQGRGLVWQPLEQTCSGQVCASPHLTFPSPTRRTGAMDSFAELRELMSLFDSGVLARDSHRMCRRWGAGRTSARRRRHESDDAVAEELEACWTTTTGGRGRPFRLRYMVLLGRPCREASQVLLRRPFSQGLPVL